MASEHIIVLTSDDEKETKRLKGQKRSRYSSGGPTAWADAAKHAMEHPFRPTTHAILLEEPLDTPEKIQEAAELSELSELPRTESVKFPPQSEEVVTFCIVEPHDYLSIYLHFLKGFTESLPIVFGGEQIKAHRWSKCQTEK